jgi:mgtE-like transporter
LIEPLKKPSENTVHNFLICYVLAIVMYPLIGFIAENSTNILGSAGVGYLNIVLISLISGLILVSIMVFVVYYISITSYNKDIDPDNVVIPISTSMTDAISSLILVCISLLILGAMI